MLLHGITDRSRFGADAFWPPVLRYLTWSRRPAAHRDLRHPCRLQAGVASVCLSRGEVHTKANLAVRLNSAAVDRNER